MNQIQDAGFYMVEDFIPEMIQRQFYLWSRSPERIHRGNATDGKYYSEHDGEREYDVWWSIIPPKEMLIPIVSQMKTLIDVFFDGEEWAMHNASTTTTRAGSNEVYAHIDTPSRFKEFNGIDEILGVQAIITLDDFTEENGGTYILPGSHKENIDIDDLTENREKYNDRLLREGSQIRAKSGTLVIWDSRTLHSVMPNNSNDFRAELLMNFVRADIVDAVDQADKNTHR
jgi:ectoine hydroxylase-related dioxygenase (phytanoyl-CoA dioxygenase family)